MSNKGADQRLICTFVIRIWHKQVFSWCGSYDLGWVSLQYVTISIQSVLWLHNNTHTFRIVNSTLRKESLTKQYWNIDNIKVITQCSTKLTGFVRDGALCWISEAWNIEAAAQIKWALSWFWVASPRPATFVEIYHEIMQTYLSHVMWKQVYALCGKQRRRSACTSAQSDQRFCFFAA